MPYLFNSNYQLKEGKSVAQPQAKSIRIFNLKISKKQLLFAPGILIGS